jgi:putative membrane protein
MYVAKRIGALSLFAHSWRVVALIALVVVVTSVVHIEQLDAGLKVSIAVAALGTAVSFFIAFFTAQAYERWWEARKIWGELVNDSRSFGRLVSTIFPSTDAQPEVARIQDRLLRRHIAYLYAVKSRLREETQTESLAFLSEPDADRVRGSGHLGNALLQLQGEDIDAAQRSDTIDVIRMAQLNDMLNRFSSSMGAAERIKLTVFPPYYASMIRLSIWGYIVVFALALSEQIGYWSMPYVFVTGAIFQLVYDAGELLLDPFEGRPNDIPMSSIVRTIEINLLEQIGEKQLPPPVEPVDGLYLM